MTQPLQVSSKIGDDFSLTVAVKNAASPSALAAEAVLTAAKASLLAAQNTVPLVPQDVLDAQEAVDAAQTAYDMALEVDISAWTITSSMKWYGKLVTSFDVVVEDALRGIFSINAAFSETSLWKPREYDADIQFVISGKKTSSDTFKVLAVRDVTNE